MPHRIVDSLFELSSDRRTSIACGETVPLAFRVANLGSAAAKAATVTFELPAGLALVEGSGLLDDVAIALKGGTAALPSLEPFDERVVRVEVRAAPAIDDGTELVLRARYADEHGTDGISPPLAFIARGTEDLRKSGTRLKLQHAPDDRNALLFTLTVKNAGTSRADGVEVDFPLPAGLRFVGGSPSAEGGELAPFDPGRLRVTFATIRAKATATASGRIAIVAPFASEAIVVDDVVVRSAAAPAFTLERVAIDAVGAVDFSGSELAALDRRVAPGERIRFALLAYNAGRSPARDVHVKADLPAGLAYARGSRTADGSPLADADDSAVTFALDAIAPGERVEFAFDANVLAPGDDEAQLTTTVTLGWRGGEPLSYEHALIVEAKPRISRSRSRLVALDGPLTDAGATVRFAIALANNGTTAMRNAQLRFAIDGFDELHLSSGTAGTLRPVYDAAQKTVHYWYDAGTLEPHVPFDLIVEAHVPSAIADRSEARVTAFARATTLAEIEIGSAAAIVRSLAKLRPSSTTLTTVTTTPVRLHQTFEFRVRVANDGTDVLRDVRCTLALPAAVAIERVTGATRSGPLLSFADVPPGASAEASIVARLVEPQRSGATLTLAGTVVARDCDPVPVASPFSVFAQPSLAAPAVTLRALPNAVVEAEVVLENVGDGIAERVTLAAHAALGFTPLTGATRVDGALVSDTGERVRLYGPYGLAIADVAPGIPVRVRWQVALDPARDPDVPLMLSLDVRAGVAGSLTVASAPFVRAIVPSVPVVVLEEPLAVPSAASYLGSAPAVETAPPEALPVGHASVRFTLDPERRDRIGRTLDVLAARAGASLVRHALVPRLFWPDSIDAGALGDERIHVEALLEGAREGVRASTTTALLKLEVPGFVPDEAFAESLDDPRLRAALAALVDALGASSGAANDVIPGPNDVQGSITLAALEALARRLESAPPGDPASSAAIAAFVATRSSSQPALAAVLEAYWDSLVSALGACREPADLLAASPELLDARLGAVRAALAEVHSEAGIA
jgi:uncharacterized repeat protein (TIGR01451 family)